MARNRLRLSETHDPEIETRINAYETAFRMQTAAPEVMNLTGETQETLNLYGVRRGPTLVRRGLPALARRPGSSAACKCATSN